MDLSSLKTSYVIFREIGRGGMGVVFQAWDRRLERNVALKILSLSGDSSQPGAASDQPAAIEDLFLQEAKAVARLNHPNIVTLYDIGGSRGRSFLVMEYVEGYNLEVLQKQHAQVPVDMVIDIGSQLCEALDYAHRQGIVHRDIKPANILLNAEGVIKLMDFGIARMQRNNKPEASGGMLGSVLYMAPEQLVDASSVDQRADIYALGVTLYELFCGSRPFQHEVVSELIREIMLAPVPPMSQFGTSIHPELEAVIQRALCKDPNERYQSAGEMRKALLAASKSQQPERPTSVPAHAAQQSVLARMPARDELYAYIGSLLSA